MELEQLVSFVRYQRGQKQGWDALDEVLTIVLESQELVKSNQVKLDAYKAEAQELQASIETLKQTRLDKLASLDQELANRRVDAENASKTAKVALEQEINAKIAEGKAIDEAIANALKNLESLQADEKRLGQRITEASEKYEQIQAKLAAIKGSL